MGGFATHDIFGKEVLEEISDEMLADIIQKHSGVFGIGCQGPDLFLYNIPMLLSNEEKNLGVRMHKENSSRYFAWLLQTIWEQKDSISIEIGLSYLYGLLAHYTLDSMLHPYIYARIGFEPLVGYSDRATDGLHHRLESAIDAKMIAAKKNILPSSYCAGESLKISREEKRILAELLSKAVSRSYHIGLKKENVTAAIAMMKVIAKGFFAVSDKQKKILQKAEKMVWKDFGLTNFMVTDDFIKKGRVTNTENCEWKNPWDSNKVSKDSVWEIYDKAVVQYYVYCGVLEKVLPYYKKKWKAGAALGRLYHRHQRSEWQQNGKEVYKEKTSDIIEKAGKRENVIGLFDLSQENGKEMLQKKIYEVAKELGNLSYDNGLSASVHSKA